MRVHNVHSRELPVPVERAWELVAGLASEHDELWPTERWPTSPIEFDRPLGPGAEGGHGLTRYGVERYEPGRRVVFRFARTSGLDGIHAFEVEATGAQRSRLTHTLDTRVGWKLLPLHPVLLAAHEALIEDLLDNAERAGGGSPAPAKQRSIATQILRWLSTRVPSQSKMARRFTAASAWPARD
jgi:hypothetical protein